MENEKEQQPQIHNSFQDGAIRVMGGKVQVGGVQNNYGQTDTAEPSKPEHQDTTGEERLNQRGLIILISELLGVSSLQTEYLPQGGQDALAYIVSMISGEKQTTLRQKIIELAKEQAEGHYKLSTVKGAEKAAELIKGFNPKISNMIRDHYDCDGDR